MQRLRAHARLPCTGPTSWTFKPFGVLSSAAELLPGCGHGASMVKLVCGSRVGRVGRVVWVGLGVDWPRGRPAPTRGPTRLQPPGALFGAAPLVLSVKHQCRILQQLLFIIHPPSSSKHDRFHVHQCHKTLAVSHCILLPVYRLLRSLKTRLRRLV